VLALLAAGELTEGHGRALLQAADSQAQRALAKEARARGLSVRQTEALARKSGSSRRDAKGRLEAVPHADAEAARQVAEDALAAALGCEVEVRLGRGRVRVELAFEDLRDVHELARRISTRLAA
jgi:ParB family chromosome partitioning protein